MKRHVLRCYCEYEAQGGLIVDKNIFASRVTSNMSIL